MKKQGIVVEYVDINHTEKSLAEVEAELEAFSIYYSKRVLTTDEDDIEIIIDTEQLWLEEFVNIFNIVGDCSDVEKFIIYTK